MKTTRTILTSIIVLCIVFVIPLWGNAQSGRTRNSQSFDDFKILYERNIFDQNRRPVSDRDRNVVRERRPSSVERIHLRGVMINEDESIAFFEGARAELSGTITRGGTIAGFTISGINTDRVTLEKSGRRLELPVGSNLMKQSEGEWEVSSSAGTQDTTPPTRGDDKVATGGSAEDSNGDDSNDILKRMMERRRRETGQ